MGNCDIKKSLSAIAVNLRNLDLSNDPGSLIFTINIGGYVKAQYYLLKDHWKMFLLLKS